MSEIMLVLAREWLIGSIVSIILVLMGYLIFSILLIRSCRKHNYDVGASAFIPLVNLVIWFRSKKYKKALVTVDISEDEEFEL